MTTVRLARIDDKAELTIKVGKKAASRWEELPEGEVERARFSVANAWKTLGDPFGARLEAMRREAAIAARMEGELADDEKEIVRLWRAGDCKAIRRLCESRMTLPRLDVADSVIDETLCVHWFPARGDFFGLCWLSAAVLVRVLHAWGFPKKARRKGTKDWNADSAERDAMNDRLRTLGLYRPMPIVGDDRPGRVVVQGKIVKIY